MNTSKCERQLWLRPLCSLLTRPRISRNVKARVMTNRLADIIIPEATEPACRHRSR